MLMNRHINIYQQHGTLFVVDVGGFYDDMQYFWGTLYLTTKLASQ